MFRHTLWMVPGVKEASALSRLLKDHPVFGAYKVANVAGDGDAEMPYDNALTLVKQVIKANRYTITISCGKLTTGVTVPGVDGCDDADRVGKHGCVRLYADHLPGAVGRGAGRQAEGTLLCL